MVEASKTGKSDWRRHFDIPYVQGAALIVLGIVILFQAAGNQWIILIAGSICAIAGVGLTVHTQRRNVDN
ncbi:hypothetical protein C3B59_01205 [Cryobacterium zongtaii]|uniref:Uncharacterized protein n=1 Tax=Cryobacterium zongtaii TaxID=1259217 RepID=A0A2S3ZQ05_9MICO|nr:hypothetical protein [Cryobacterium zongtaii]POH71253.1 hypothetical protein C3B59_01205 [Cryobacterium zongtaii]